MPATEARACVAANQWLLRVLVVNSDREEAQNLATFVALCGHETRMIHEIERLIAAMSAYQPNVLLMDLAASSIDRWWEVIRLCREARSQSILLVAIGESAREPERAGVGFDRYLGKPIDPAMLEELLLMEFRRLVRSLNARRPAVQVPSTVTKSSSPGVCRPAQGDCETRNPISPSGG
jgi:CheY-like chemotaxis protein